MTEEQALQNLNVLVSGIRNLALAVDAALDDNRISGAEPFQLLMQTTMLGNMIYGAFVVPAADRKIYLDVLAKVQVTM